MCNIRKVKVTESLASDFYIYLVFYIVDRVTLIGCLSIVFIEVRTLRLTTRKSIDSPILQLRNEKVETLNF